MVAVVLITTRAPLLSSTLNANEGTIGTQYVVRDVPN